MKKITLISMAISLGFASFSVNAKNPHPSMLATYNGLYESVTCMCDWSTDPSTCTVSWVDVNAPSYGVSIDFEAEWMEGDVEMESSAELNLDDNWLCDESGTCSASDEFDLADHPVDAVIKFVGKVKGFDIGSDGVRSRNFIKATGICNLPADG